MTDEKTTIKTILVTGAALTAISASSMTAANPFEADVFRSETYQIADLDEDGCGGEMTEYRVNREPEPTNDTEEKSNDEDNIEKESETLPEKEGFSFWSWLFG